MVEVTKEKNTFLELNALANRYDDEGRMQLDKDKEAVTAYFKEHVLPNTITFITLEEKLAYLWDNDYYERDLFDQYTSEFVKSLFRRAYNAKFRFASFVGAYKFYNQYALRTFDGERYLERFEDRVVCNALLLAGGDTSLAEQIVDEIISGRYQPATPTFLNAGKKQRGSYVSCYLIEASDDLNSIGRAWNSAAQLSKNGGGVAFNLTNIRAAGDPIKNVQGASDGIVPVMKVFEDIFTYANQLGARQGAGAVYLNAHHLDILDFLDTKKENADEKRRIKTLSMGVVVPDITMELFENGEDMYLFSPYDVSKKYGKPFADVNITEVYRELVDDPDIRKKKIPARTFFARLAEVQMESGYPYVMFEDTVNKANPIDGKIKMSNLCVEILQVQKASVLNDDQSYSDIGRDISCNLGSLNIARAMESPDFGKTIETAVRSLSWVATHSDMTVVPSIKDGNAKARAIGLGAMNLHGWLAENKIEYGSPEALEATGLYFYLVNYHAIRTSMLLAIETGEVFDGFENSDYASGEYFVKYTKDYAPKSLIVKGLFSGVRIPTPADWEQLSIDVQYYGMHNQNLQAVPPTGSISYINNSVPSILPTTAIIENRKEGKMGTVFYPSPGLRDDNREYYKDAYQLGWKAIIDTAAAAQEHIDQSISTTLFFLDSVDTKELNSAYFYAWLRGLKTVYYVRVKNDSVDGTQDIGCVSCAV